MRMMQLVFSKRRNLMTKKLSLDDFKNWLSEQKESSNSFNFSKEPEDPNERFIGKEARTKVCESKLLERIRTNQDSEQLVQEFMEEGGIVLSVKGKKVELQVESGEFTIPRFCVKIRK